MMDRAPRESDPPDGDHDDGSEAGPDDRDVSREREDLKSRRDVIDLAQGDDPKTAGADDRQPEGPKERSEPSDAPDKRKPEAGEKPGTDGRGTDGGGQDSAASDSKAEPDDNPPKPPPKMVFVVAGLLLLALLAWGAYSHWRSYQASKQTSADTTDRPVEIHTAEARRLDAPIDLTLPGETQAYDTASIYPRATGYIRDRLVDIGSRVKKGDILVHIAAPDLDQQLAQAEAQIGQTRAALVQAQAQATQAEANLNLAKVNFARTNQLAQQGYDSQQNRDQRQADVQTQQANVESAKAGIRVGEANVAAQQAAIDRLKALAAFEDVRAPFEGIVTARNVDLGELVNADSISGAPMFTVIRDDIIRVMTRVPQNAAIGIHQGLEARIAVPQMPKRDFAGRVERSSVALLYSSRSLTTEVDVPNANGDLRPGLYVSVSFAIPRDHPEVNVPAEALMFNQHGMQVATVEGDHTVLHEVNIGRDHGTNVDLRDGLAGGERVVVNPPATLKDGTKVKEIREEDEKKKDEEDKKAAMGQQSKAAETPKK